MLYYKCTKKVIKLFKEELYMMRRYYNTDYIATLNLYSSIEEAEKELETKGEFYYLVRVYDSKTKLFCGYGVEY